LVVRRWGAGRIPFGFHLCDLAQQQLDDLDFPQ
jgi:hypothetical protein